MTKIIGIVGSRRRQTTADFNLLVEALDKVYVDGDWLVSGGCSRGADNFAEMIAKQRGYSILIHYPNMGKYGSPQCFFERNTLIARDCNVLIALCHEDRTGGTEDTVRKALKLSKEVILVESSNFDPNH